MQDQVEFAVTHNGMHIDCMAMIIRTAYSYQLKVTFDNCTVYFEPDEENILRAMSMPWQSGKEVRSIDKSLLRVI